MAGNNLFVLQFTKIVPLVVKGPLSHLCTLAVDRNFSTDPHWHSGTQAQWHTGRLALWHTVGKMYQRSEVGHLYVNSCITK